MFFNRINGKIVNVILSPSEKKAAHAEIVRQLVADTRKHELDSLCTVLWVMRDDFGISRSRCRKLMKALIEKNREMEAHYQMDNGDGPWICRQKLINDGCDVDAWYEEYGEEAKGVSHGTED